MTIKEGDEKIKRTIEYLSAVDSMIPIYSIKTGRSDERGELLGGLYLL